MRKSGLLVLAATLATGLAPGAFAQSTTDDTQVLISQIQTDKRAIVLASMGLDEAQTKAFMPIYDAYQADRMSIYDSSVKLLDKFAANYESMTDDAAKGILDDWFKMRDSEREMMHKYAKKIAKDVSPTKALRFVQIENKLNTIMDVEAARIVPLVK